MSLGLDKANATQGLELIPAGSLVELVMRIKPGNVGLENLLKRSAKGDSEYLDTEFTVTSGPYAKRKVFDIMVLEGTKDGHAKAGKISRAKLRAIFESAHGIDPNDSSPTATSQRANASLAGFNGATFLATVEVEAGSKRPDGSGNYKDKNIIGRILRIGDSGYRQLAQPAPAPIERSTPPAQSQPAPAASGAPAAATLSIAKPGWAQ